MAFFDEIGRKISLAGEGAVSKGRAFADVARLNSAVSEEEKKINNSYYQIGKLYVALHPQDYEADFAALVGSIVSSQSKIQTLKRHIKMLSQTITILIVKMNGTIKTSMIFPRSVQKSAEALEA